ncbi:hypothetical protein HYQ46_000665 [Verticillium longisporum]|nr:hypothetical protein HYQ44_019512 [Verticillium longisporum]KAG7150393.1 hypothetical protein HYQ46_000665 [Verticillium longisporum]
MGGRPGQGGKGVEPARSLQAAGRLKTARSPSPWTRTTIIHRSTDIFPCWHPAHLLHRHHHLIRLRLLSMSSSRARSINGS